MKDKIIAFLMKPMRIEVATAAIIRKGDKVLLAKRAKTLPDGGKWCLPGGHVSKWERAEECIKRELKEELGVNAKKTKFEFVHEEFVKRLGLHAVVFVYSVSVEGKFKPNWEVSDFGWFDKKDIEKLDLAFTHKEVFNKSVFRRKK